MEPSSQNPNPTAPPNANRISIVTKSEIRYEGVLYHINPQDQNITLCNVKSFGTEGRRPGDEIGPSPQVHEYIIFRGTDIKDLKVLEESKQQQAQPETQPVKKPEQNVEQTPAPREQNREAIQPEKSMKRGENQEDFDFQAMREKFQEFASEHKPSDVNVKTYHQNDFFDNLSTSTADKAREQPFDRIAQKKTDKETFGSEYVDTATSRGRGRYGRGGGRGGYNRGGYNRGGGYHGGQNRNYGGQNRNYEGQQRNYEGGQQRNYEGGQQRNYGGQQRNYGGQNRGYGNQNRQYDNQGGYNQGGYNQGGYNQRKYGDQDNRQQRGEGGYQSGPRYYKNYQESGHNQDQGGDNRGDNRENKNY